MSRIRNAKALVVAASLPLLYLAGVAPHAPARLTIVPDALAVVGAPLTPASAAGVARRTTRRVVVASSAANTSETQQQQTATAQQQAATAQQQAAVAQQQAAVAQQQAAAAQSPYAGAPRPAGAPAVGSVATALPAGCKPETKSGVEYQNCGGVYYRPAFQGNNLVYVAQ